MKLVPKGISQAVFRQILTTKKNSPHIFFAAGVVGVVGGAYLACRATLKLEDTLDEIQEDIQEVKELHNSPDDSNLPERQYNKDLARVYVKSTVKVVRLYGPAMLVGTASIAALTGSHIQLARRNAALTATLAAVSKAYDEYRERIKQELGEKRELDIYRDIKEEKGPDGKNIKYVGDKQYSPYARCFDQCSTRWQPSPEHNYATIKCQQSYLNNMLVARGHVLLNDAYDALGFERTSAGAVVGWIFDKHGHPDRDGFIDFGLNMPGNERFLAGNEVNVWLDFNVDGVIYELIDGD